MPFSFQFLRQGQPVNLNEVDEAMCKNLGIACNPKQFCNLFMWCQWLGTCPKVQNDSGSVDAEKLQASPAWKDCSSEEQRLLLKYLCGEYQFSAWYSR